jgi:ArsR family transcriptional regulator
MKQLETAGLIETRRDGKLVRATLRRKTWKSYLAHLKSFAA